MKKQKENIKPLYRVKLETSYVVLGVYLIGSCFLIALAITQNNPQFTLSTIIFEILFLLLILQQFYNAFIVKYPKNKKKQLYENNKIDLFSQIVYKIDFIEKIFTIYEKNENLEKIEEFYQIKKNFQLAKKKFHNLRLNNENIDIKLLKELSAGLNLMQLKLEKKIK